LSDQTPWRRLHPASIWVNALPRTLKSLGAMWWLLIPFFMGDNKATIGIIELVVLVVVLGSGLISSFIHYTTLRYRLFEGMLEVRYGLLNRRSRRLDPHRIQNIELVKNPLHKAFGLVELRVETAGEAREEGLLSGMNEDEASRLRAAMEAIRTQGSLSEEAPTHEQEILTVSFMELLAFGLSASLRTYVVSLIVVMSVAQFLRNDETGIFYEWSVKLGGSFMLIAGVFGIFVAFFSVVFKGVIRHWQHRLVKEPLGMRTEEGLFTRRKVEIPFAKVQVLKIREPLLRRMMGYGTVHVETAGLGSVKEGLFSAETVIPMVHTSELEAALAAASPSLEIDPWSVELKRPALCALRRARVAGCLEAAPLILAVSILFYPLGLLSFLLVPWVFFWSRLDWDRYGWFLSEGHLVVQRGVFQRETRVVALEKVQALHVFQGPLMRWYGLARLHVFVADAQVSFPPLDEAECIALFEALSKP
jgi:putative membrane protein